MPTPDNNTSDQEQIEKLLCELLECKPSEIQNFHPLIRLQAECDARFMLSRTK